MSTVDSRWFHGLSSQWSHAFEGLYPQAPTHSKLPPPEEATAIKTITIVAAIRTTGQISVSGPISSVIRWFYHHPFAWWWFILCDPLVICFPVDVWVSKTASMCLCFLSIECWFIAVRRVLLFVLIKGLFLQQGLIPWMKPIGSILVRVDGWCTFCVRPLEPLIFRFC